MKKIFQIFLFLSCFIIFSVISVVSWAMESDFTGKNGVHYRIRPMKYTEEEEGKLIVLEKINADHIEASHTKAFFNYIRDEGSLVKQGFFLRYYDESGWNFPVKSWVTESVLTGEIVAEVFVLSPSQHEISTIVHPTYRRFGISIRMYNHIYDYNRNLGDQRELSLAFKDRPDTEKKFNYLLSLTLYEDFKDTFDGLIQEEYLQIQQGLFQGIFASVHIDNLSTVGKSFDRMTHVFSRYEAYEGGLHIGFSLQNWCDVFVREEVQPEDFLLDRHFYCLFLPKAKMLMMGGAFGFENKFVLTDESNLALEAIFKSIRETDGFKRINFDVLRSHVPDLSEIKILVGHVALGDEGLRDSALEELQKRFPGKSSRRKMQE